MPCSESINVRKFDETLDPEGLQVKEGLLEVQRPWGHSHERPADRLTTQAVLAPPTPTRARGDAGDVAVEHRRTAHHAYPRVMSQDIGDSSASAHR
jgi:hypothetical protein